MSRSLDSSDFRSVRIVLEPSDFALSNGRPDPPPGDLIDRETWLSIVTLPDDVAIRTSSHHGSALHSLHGLWGALIEMVALENQDALDTVLIDAADDFQGAIYAALCGYYRLSFTSLRSVLELSAIGADAQLSGNLAEFENWRAGRSRGSFDAACIGLNRSSRGQQLRGHLRRALSDSLFDPKQPSREAGWARRLHETLSNYSHARPGFTDADARQSNGPIYVPQVFEDAAAMHFQVAAFVFIAVNLVRPGVALQGSELLFLPSHQRLPRIAHEAWRKLR